MTFFSTIRTKRNTAFVVLLVWLFALASGVANACLLEAHEMRSSGAAKASQAPGEFVVHRQSATGHDDGSDSSKETCLKACDDGSHTLLKAQSGVDQTDPGTAPLIATLWSSATPVAGVARRVEDLQVPLVGPPFRVRYSRLTL
jgi:hypothetical protein